MNTLIHWALLIPILTIFIGTTIVLTEIVRSTGGQRWAILVPVSAVLLIAGAAYSLAQVGAFCAFCEYANNNAC